MDFIYWGAWIVIFILLMTVILLPFSDCDLSLRCKEGRGKKPVDVLTGKVVWVTGASSGIGEYLVYELCKARAKLVLSARRQAELERVKNTCIEQYNGKAENILVLPLDLLKFDSHKQATDLVLDYFGQLDILVNNGGRSQRALAVETDFEVDRQIMDLNYFGTVSLTKAVLPHFMKRREGHIVNTSSLAGKLGAPLSAAYAATKHAMQGWFDTLRLELADTYICITNVCPGPVVSNGVKESFTSNVTDKLGSQPVDRRVSTERCAFLMAVAIANKLDEVWISKNPVLLFCYLSQYIPTLYKWAGKKLGMKVIKSIRGHKE